jgi:LacI family transcriptional regulator
MTTIGEIAANLGVTPATVSRALNEKAGVSATLRAAIRAEAARLSFVANGAAQSLRTSRTMTAAMIVARPKAVDHLAEEPFYGPIMFGIEEELRDHAYHLLISTLSDAQLERPDDPNILRGRVDGLIMVGPRVPARLIRALRKRGMPVVLVDTALEDHSMDTVLPEDRIGAGLLAEHLLAHGHRRFAILSGPDEWVTNHERCAGFVDVLRAARLEPVAVLHAEATTESTGYRLMQEALSHQPTAVLAINDRMAMGAIDAAHGAGLSVPADIAVTGYDDIAPVARMSPPLTTIHIPTEEMGRCAASRLLSRIRRPDAPPRRTLIATSLVLRRSCGCDAKPSPAYSQSREELS